MAWAYTDTDDEAALTAPDWSIANEGESRSHDATGNFSTVSGARFQLRVNGEAGTQAWSATLTVADLGGSTLGCSDTVTSKNCNDASILSEDEFDHGSTHYDVVRVSLSTSGRLEIEFGDPYHADILNLVLSVDGKLFALSDSVQTSATGRHWLDTGLSWSENDTVTVKLIDLRSVRPLKPPPPVVTAVPRTTDSLKIRPVAPDNTGRPAITSYDIHVFDGGNWVDGPQNVTTETVTIDMLAASSVNVYRVRATNTNGDSHWSELTYGITFSEPNKVESWDAFLPTGLGAGDRFRWLWVTSDRYQAELGYHVSYDLELNNGDVGLLSNRIHSLISTPHADARVTTNTTHTTGDRGVPIYWFNGAKVADDYPDLYDGSWDDEANPRDEDGNAVSISAATQPWTGSANDGTELFVGGDSRAVGQDQVGYGALGSTTTGEGPLYSGSVAANTGTRPLYVMSGMLFVGEAPLVGNLGQPHNDDVDDRDEKRAQRFTTGARAAEMTGVGISWWDFQDDAVTVKVYTVDTDGDPDAVHATLTASDSVDTSDDYSVYTAPENTMLAASTTYAVVVEPATSGADVELGVTASDGEDAAGADGWTIQDAFDIESGGNWSPASSGESLRLIVQGTESNTAPTATPGSVTTLEDTPYTFDASDFNFSDTENDAFASVKITSVPATGTLAVDGSAITSGDTPRTVSKSDIDADRLTYTPVANAHGTVTFNFKVNDGIEDSAEVLMTVTITAVNDAPTVAVGILDQTATAGMPFSFAFPASTFADVDAGTTLTYTATKADGSPRPAWLAFTSATRLFSGTPQEADVGALALKVTADDGAGGSVSDEFTITVDSPNAPVFNPASVTRSVAENTAPGQSIGSPVTATDPDGDVLTYSLAGADAAAFAIDSASGQIQTSGALDHESRSSYSLQVRADDNNGHIGTANVRIDVTDVNEPPVAPAAPTLSAPSDSATSLEASWTAPANAGKPPITRYAIEYREGRSGNWTAGPTSLAGHAYTLVGLRTGTLYQARVKAFNDEGESGWSGSGEGTTNTSANRAPTVVEQIPDQLALVGQEFVYFLPAGMFRDPDSDDTLTYSASLADGSALPSWLSFTARVWIQGFEGTPPTGTEGTVLQVRVTATDSENASGSDVFAIRIEDPADLAIDFGTSTDAVVKVRESETRHRLQLLLSGAAPGALTIPIEVTHLGGASTADYEDLPRNVTIPQGASQASFFIRAIPDGIGESGEGLRLDFGTLPAGVRKGTWGPHETIEFVDQLRQLTASFGAETYTATEGGAAAEVAINLDAAVDSVPADVHLRVEYGGGATAADHGSIPEVLTFAVGERTRTIRVSASDDNDDDDGESVSLTLVRHGRVTDGWPRMATVTLADDDGVVPVKVSFDAPTYTATEGGTGATVSVNLDTAPGRAVTVPLTADYHGGASAADYSTIPSNVAFGESETVKTFTVSATADSDDDGGESVSIAFGDLPDGVSAGRPATATVTVSDGTEQRLEVYFGTAADSNPIIVREGSNAKFITLNLNHKAQRPVTIPLLVTHTGGAEEADHTPIPTTVTFQADRKLVGFNLQAIPDDASETGEGLRLDMGDLPPGVTKDTWGPYEIIAFEDAADASATVAGWLLTLGYPDSLDRTSTPAPRDFVVLAQAPDGAQTMVGVTGVAIDGSAVVLDLERAVTADETVTLTYLPDAMHPIRGTAGFDARPLTGKPVRNDTGASGPPSAMTRAGTVLPAPLVVALEAARMGMATVSLDLSSRRLTDVSALAELTGLRELDLHDNAITDLSPLGGLTGLRALHLGDNAIEDTRPLSDLHELRMLDLSGNRVADLWPLADLDALRRLSVADNRIDDIAALAELTTLRALDLSANGVADLWPLAGAVTLEWLNLADNEVADLAALEELHGLRVLDLAGNGIAGAWPLAGLVGLERLNLAGNRLTDLGPLPRFSGLRVLLLDGNQVADVAALSGLGALANLGLAGNRLADVGVLADLGGLRRLDVANNAIADASALADLKGLVWLRFAGNPGSGTTTLVRLEQLRWLRLEEQTASARQ